MEPRIAKQRWAPQPQKEIIDLEETVCLPRYQCGKNIRSSADFNTAYTDTLNDVIVSLEMHCVGIMVSNEKRKSFSFFAIFSFYVFSQKIEDKKRKNEKSIFFIFLLIFLLFLMIFESSRKMETIVGIKKNIFFFKY